MTVSPCVASLLPPHENRGGVEEGAAIGALTTLPTTRITPSAISPIGRSPSSGGVPAPDSPITPSKKSAKPTNSARPMPANRIPAVDRSCLPGERPEEQHPHADGPWRHQGPRVGPRGVQARGLLDREDEADRRHDRARDRQSPTRLATGGERRCQEDQARDDDEQRPRGRELEAGDIRGEEDSADEDEDDAEDDGPATILFPCRHPDATP